MVVNATSCHLASFFIGIAEICFMSAPVGQCDYCCPRDDTVDIQYKLFTRSNPTTFQIIPPNDADGLRATAFNFASPTVIYLMGFSESTGGVGTTTVKDAHLSAGNYNFIAVDWSRLIVFPWYVSAVRNSRYMGMQLANFIQFLDSVGVPASTIHVVGFSLGAEAAGFAGKNLRSKGLVLGRITGLDPAYPGYSLSNNDGHLAKGDAAFVDVLHTNPGVFGFLRPIGDVDFYANPGNWIQPGCWVDELIRNREFRFVYGCSHVRAWRLYSESLSNPRGFPATLCPDWTSATRPCTFQVHGYMGIAASAPRKRPGPLEGLPEDTGPTRRGLFEKNGMGHSPGTPHGCTIGMQSWIVPDECRTIAKKYGKNYWSMEMGVRMSGKMYFKTNASPPFAKNGP